MIDSWSNPNNQNRIKKKKNMQIKKRKHKLQQKQKKIYENYFVFSCDQIRFNKKFKKKVKLKKIIKELLKEKKIDKQKNKKINEIKPKGSKKKYSVFIDHVICKFYFASNQRIKKDESNLHINLFDITNELFIQAKEDQESLFDNFNNLSNFLNFEFMKNTIAKFESLKKYLMDLILKLQKYRKIIKIRTMIKNTRKNLKYSYYWNPFLICSMMYYLPSSNLIRSVSKNIDHLKNIMKIRVKSINKSFTQRMISFYKIANSSFKNEYFSKWMNSTQIYNQLKKYKKKNFVNSIIDNKIIDYKKISIENYKNFYVSLANDTKKKEVFSTTCEKFYSIFHLARNWFIVVIKLKNKYQFCVLSFDMQKKTNKLKMNILSRSFLVLDKVLNVKSVFHFKDARSIVIIEKKKIKIYKYKINVDLKIFDFYNVPFVYEIPDFMSIFCKYIENKKTLRLLAIENNQVCFFDYDICNFDNKNLEYKKTICKKIVEEDECFNFKKNANSLFYHTVDDDMVDYDFAYILVQGNLTDNYDFNKQACLLDSSGRIHFGISVLMFAQFPHIYIYKYNSPSFTFLQKIQLPDLADNLKPGLFYPNLFFERHPYMCEFTWGGLEGNKFGFMLDIGCDKYFYEFCLAKFCFVKIEYIKDYKLSKWRYDICFHTINDYSYVNKNGKKQFFILMSKNKMINFSKADNNEWQKNFSISHINYQIQKKNGSLIIYQIINN